VALLYCKQSDSDFRPITYILRTAGPRKAFPYPLLSYKTPIPPDTIL
jgi:hypothetical protein